MTEAPSTGVVKAIFRINSEMKSRKTTPHNTTQEYRLFDCNRNTESIKKRFIHYYLMHLHYEGASLMGKGLKEEEKKKFNKQTRNNKKKKMKKTKNKTKKKNGLLKGRFFS